MKVSLFLGSFLVVGLVVSSIGRIGNLKWWGEVISGFIAREAVPVFGLEGEASGWGFHLTRTLPSALGFPLFTLMGFVGLFFGIRSRGYARRFLFWGFCIVFIVVGGVQDRRAESVLPLGILLSGGAGLFVASFWNKLRGHPGAAVLTLLVGFMLALPLPRLVAESLILLEKDSRVLAKEFLEKNKQGKPGILTILPVKTCRGFTRDFYPPLGKGFSFCSLCTMKTRPLIDHKVWAMIERKERDGKTPWKYYIWSSWADGLMEERKKQYFNALEALRVLLSKAELVAEFGGPDTDDAPGKVDAPNRVVIDNKVQRPGPLIRIFSLRQRGTETRPLPGKKKQEHLDDKK